MARQLDPKAREKRNRAILKAHRNGKSVAEITEKFDVTHTVVYRLLQGDPERVQRIRPWTAREDRKLMRSGKSPSALEQEMDRTAQAIKWRRAVLRRSKAAASAELSTS